MTWCAEKIRDIHQRFGAVGQDGSIAVFERFMRSLKQECTRQIRVPQNPDDMRGILSMCLAWYNQFLLIRDWVDVFPWTSVLASTPEPTQ